MQKLKRKLQIGVMGSAADLKYSKKIEKLAFEVGKLIAESGNITIYGAEKDYDSLSTAAARGAKRRIKAVQADDTDAIHSLIR